MRCKRIFLGLALGALAVGCETPVGEGLEIARYATRNFLEAPVDARDDCLERCRNRHVAEEAWQAVLQAHPERVYSPYYAEGFQDGFADFLYAGGPPEPPVVPPWKYRRAAYETAEGNRAIEDWFAGFRHGAHAALESGLREVVVMPAALRPPDRSPPFGGPLGAGPQMAPAEGTDDATLPAPRKEQPLPAGKGAPPAKEP